MAITVKHKFVSAIPDDTDTTIVRPSNWNDDHQLTGTVPVANGGTGTATLTGYVIGNGTSAMTASTTIPSGDVSGLGTMATQNANAIAVTGGTINGTTIGATTASTGAFTYASTNSSTSTTPALSYNASNSAFVNGATVSGSYLQNVMQNKSGTAGASTNFAVSNDLGTDSTYYGEFGMNSSVYSASTPADFFSLNNGVYFSSHDGDVTVGSGNGYKTYLAWGTVGQSAHVINASGALGLNTNITGTSNFGTNGQMLLSAGSAATPTWSNAPTISGGTIDNTVIGGTTPAAGTFTTITGQTEVLKGTGQNLATFTTTLNNANYSQSGLTLTAGQTDPFSGTTAALLNDGTSSGTHYVLVGNLVGGTQTFSCYAKAGTSNYLGLYFAGTGSGVYFNLTTGAFSSYINSALNLSNYTSTSVGGGWWRLSITISGSANYFWMIMSENGTSYSFTGTSQTVFVAAPQIEASSTVSTYIPNTTGSIIYGIPSLSFNGVAGLGLEYNGALYVSPAGTGALQAQKTDSTATGGNARGANAVDWQTVRTGATQVASGYASVLSGGYANISSGSTTTVAGGSQNQAIATNSFVGGGTLNVVASTGYTSNIVGGYSNTASGYFNIIGGGTLNSGTSGSAVTTQATTIAVSAGTTFYLTATNANIKVGQLVTGTGVSFPNTYATSTVTTGTAAVMNTSTISGTTLTVGSLASGTIIAGMVITGTGVTAGTYIVSGSASTWTVSTSQTVASTTITGTAYTFTISQAATTAAGVTLSFYTPHGVVVGGGNNQATGAYSFIGGGGDAGTAANRNLASGDWSAILGGRAGTTRGITGFQAFPACSIPIASGAGYSQAGLLILGKQTTDATATVITSDGLTASISNQVILPNNSAYYFKVRVIAGVTGAGDTKAWTLEGAIKRGAGVGTTAIVGTVTTTVIATDAGAATWAVTATADTTNGGLKITVTGQAATTIRWVAKAETAEMTY